MLWPAQPLLSLVTRHSSLSCPFRVYVAALRMIDALVCVRAEVIALRLRQVLRQARRAIAVEVGEARAHRRHSDPHAGGRLQGQPPVRLRRLYPAVERFVKQKIGEVGAAIIRTHDRIEEARADDAATLPDARHFTEVDAPGVLRRAPPDQAHALRVGANL